MISPNFTQNLHDFINDPTLDCYSRISNPLNSSHIVYPGSFNPLHVGHLSIVNHAENTFQKAVLFEICVTRFDKPSMSEEEIVKIERQFKEINRPYVFTRFSSFLQKLHLFYTFRNDFKKISHCRGMFLLGIDTLSRIQDKMYYMNDTEEMSRCLRIFGEHEIDFIVFPRNGQKKIEVCFELKDQVKFIESWEEIKVSSTDLRNSVKDFCLNNQPKKSISGVKV